MSTIQRITSPYKIHTDFNKVDLPRSSESYVEVAAVSRFGILLSAGLVFNNKAVLVKCVVDDITIFEVNLSNLKDMLPQGEDSSSVGLPFTFDDGKDLFTFKPSGALMFRNSIKFYAKASTNSSSRDFEGIVIEYTEE